MRLISLCCLIFLSSSLLAADLPKKRKRNNCDPLDMLIEAARILDLIMPNFYLYYPEPINPVDPLDYPEQESCSLAVETKFNYHKPIKPTRRATQRHRMCGISVNNVVCDKSFGQTGDALMTHHIKDHGICEPTCFVMQEKWRSLPEQKTVQGKERLRKLAKKYFAAACVEKYPFLNDHTNMENYVPFKCNNLYCNHISSSDKERKMHENEAHNGEKVYFCGSCFFVSTSAKAKVIIRKHLVNLGKTSWKKQCNRWQQAYIFQQNNSSFQPEVLNPFVQEEYDAEEEEEIVIDSGYVGVAGQSC